MLRHSATGSRHGGELARRLLFPAKLMGLLLGASLWSHTARAQDGAPSKASCAEAYESAQESRASGALQETRSRLAYCAQIECPAFVQKDCARWLGEVDKELPSVVVSVVGLDAGMARAASLKIDGRPIPDPLSGKTISLDPGKHELVLERPGEEPLTRTILAQQGVQNRGVEFRLGPAPEEGAPLAYEADTATANSSPLRNLAYVGWGVGAVGLGTFAVVGTLARADKERFKEECAGVTNLPENVMPGVCLDTEIESHKSRYQREEVVADVGLVVGLVGAATGTVLFVLSLNQGNADQAKPDAASSAALRFDVSPAPGGAWASLSGAF